MRRIVREIVHTVTVERWIVEEVPASDDPPALPAASPALPPVEPVRPKPRRPRKPSTARRKKTKR